MPRPNRTAERRREVLPTVAAAFAELGYRKATTAELARRCGLRENQLYRLWPEKRAMFVASIDWLFDLAVERWREALDAGGGTTPAEAILAHEARHRGRSGLYRIIFAGLTETDDPRVRAALRRMYRRFHRFIAERVAEHRVHANANANANGDAAGAGADASDAARTAWAVIGVATMGDITRELRLLPEAGRRTLLMDSGLALLNTD